MVRIKLNQTLRVASRLPAGSSRIGRYLSIRGAQPLSRLTESASTHRHSNLIEAAPGCHATGQSSPEHLLMGPIPELSGTRKEFSERIVPYGENCQFGSGTGNRRGVRSVVRWKLRVPVVASISARRAFIVNLTARLPNFRWRHPTRMDFQSPGGDR